MAIAVLFGVFALLLIVGPPVAFCLGIAAAVLYLGLPPIVVVQQLNSGMNAFSMLAIPLFIFAGAPMIRGGIADRLDTAELRRHFLFERLFVPGAVSLAYSHVERFVVGGAVPTAGPLSLDGDKATIGAPNVLDRHELGVFNIGGPGTVEADGRTLALGPRDAAYIAKDTRSVTFRSDDASSPARFYLLSTPAHATFETKVIRIAEAKSMTLGDQATAAPSSR